MTIPTPGPTPIQPTRPPSETPQMGPEGQSSFSLPQKGSEKLSEAKQSPMDAAKEKPASPRWTNEDMMGKMQNVHDRLDQTKTRLQGTEGEKLTRDHHDALSKLTRMMDRDFRSIAQKTNGAYAPPEKKGGPVEQLTNWLDGAQGALNNAMAFVPKVGRDGNMEPSQFLELQYSMQRATQKLEVFNSVISSTVSGIKNLMSTQLG